MSTTTEPAAGALAVREQSGAAIVRPVPIPRELQELGVRIAEEEDTGLRVIVLPAAVRQAVNLLTPVSSWNQADPNWTPSISLVQLDEAAHTYPLPGGKKGLNKQALETLGKCAGVLYTRTARVPHHELQPGEDYAYRATVGFRRSDGTIDEVTRERGFQREAEQADIEGAVRSSERYPTPEAQAAEIRKRWIAELRFGPAKTESKAINRALRAGLAIPAAVDRGALAKPFLVVGFNFSPDYTDPEVKRALVAVAMNAQAAIYGGRDVSEQLPEIGAGDIPSEAIPPASADDGGGPGPDAESAANVGEQGGGGDPHEPDASGPIGGDAAAASSSGTSLGSETTGAQPGGGSVGTGAPLRVPTDVSQSEPTFFEPPAEPGLTVPASAIEAAAQTVIATVHTDEDGQTTTIRRTITEILNHPAGADWVLWALSSSSTLDPDAVAALGLVVQHRAPDLWARATGEAA